MSEEELTQINVAVPSAALGGLCDYYGWTRQEAVTTALRALNVLMGMHEQQADEIGKNPDNAKAAQLYLRFAREAPAGLIQVHQDLEFRHLPDRSAALRCGGWLIFKDPDSPAVLAIEEATGRPGQVVDGEVKLFKLPEAALN